MICRRALVGTLGMFWGKITILSLSTPNLSNWRLSRNGMTILWDTPSLLKDWLIRGKF
jgi:hypothetical protein